MISSVDVNYDAVCAKVFILSRCLDGELWLHPDSGDTETSLLSLGGGLLSSLLLETVTSILAFSFRTSSFFN